MPHALQYINRRALDANKIIDKYGIVLHYIESAANPADMLTKDFTKIYNELPLWTLGPEIIRTDS